MTYGTENMRGHFFFFSKLCSLFSSSALPVWKYPCFEEAIHERYLSNPARLDSIHFGLCLFHKGSWSSASKPLLLSGGSVKQLNRLVPDQPWLRVMSSKRVVPNASKLAWPFHELALGRLSELVPIMFNFELLESVFRLGCQDKLLQLWNSLLNLSMDDNTVQLQSSYQHSHNGNDDVSVGSFSNIDNSLAFLSVHEGQIIPKKHLIQDARDFFLLEREFLFRYPHQLLQRAANQPESSALSFIARRLLSSLSITPPPTSPSSSGSPPPTKTIPWADWENRPRNRKTPSDSFITKGSLVESVDICDTRVVTVSKDISSKSSAEWRCFVELFDRFTDFPVKYVEFPIQGKLARVQFSLSGSRIAYSDGLVVRFLDANTLSCLTPTPLWAHSKFYENIAPEALAVGVMLLQWFDCDAKLATCTGVYDELLPLITPSAPPLDCEVLIWDTVSLNMLQVFHTYRMCNPLSSSPLFITFRPNLGSSGTPFWVDLEMRTAQSGLLPGELSFPDEVDGDGNAEEEEGFLDLIDLSVFWPSISEVYGDSQESAILKSVCNPVTIAVCRYSPFIVSWDPVFGIYLAEILPPLELGGARTTRIIARLPLSQLALETQATFPFVGRDGDGNWGVEISPDGSKIAIPIDGGRIGIWGLDSSSLLKGPASQKEIRNRRQVPVLSKLQTVEGMNEFTFSADGGDLIVGGVNHSASLWRIPRSCDQEEWRPLLKSIDVKFMPPRDSMEDKGRRMELVILDKHGIISITDLGIKSIYWQGAACPQDVEGEIAYGVFTHPKAPLIATITNKCRVHFWLYDHTERTASYIQTITQISPGTRISNLAFSPSLLVGSEGYIEITISHQTGQVTVWKTDLKSPAYPVSVFGGVYVHRGIHSSIGYSLDGEYVYCLSSDGFLFYRHCGSDRVYEYCVDPACRGDAFQAIESSCSVATSTSHGLNHGELIAAGLGESNSILLIARSSSSASDVRFMKIKVGSGVRQLSFIERSRAAALLLVFHSDNSVSMWNIANTSTCIHSFVLDGITSLQTPILSSPLKQQQASLLSSSLQISTMDFALDESRFVVKTDIVEHHGNVFMFVLRNIPISSTSTTSTEVRDWKVLESRHWTASSRFMKSIVLRRDAQMLSVMHRLAEQQRCDVPILLASCLEACCLYDDVTQFDPKYGRFMDPWIEGIDWLIKLGARVDSKEARRALMVSSGLRFQQSTRKFVMTGIRAENDVKIIHGLFLECLSDWYEELPKGRRSFILKILEITGEAGVNALSFDDNALICRASYLGRNEVVKLCIEYGSSVNSRGETPVLNAIASDSRDTFEILKNEGRGITLKREHVYNWMVLHAKDQKFQHVISTLIKNLLSELPSNIGIKSISYNDWEVLRLIAKRGVFNDLLGVMSVHELDVGGVIHKLAAAAMGGRDAAAVIAWLSDKYGYQGCRDVIEELHLFSDADFSLSRPRYASSDNGNITSKTRVFEGFTVAFHPEVGTLSTCQSSFPLSFWKTLDVHGEKLYYYEVSFVLKDYFRLLF